MSDLLNMLIMVNEPHIVAQVLGWFCVCHLRTHLSRLYRQFPLLGLWGSAGSGKTMTANLFAALSGCYSESGDGSISLADITPFAMVNFCSSTTTVPRILEEYNRSKMHQRNYDSLGEIMKMSWDQNIKAMGTLRRSNANGRGRSGAEVVEYPITSPLAVISEQAPQMPALKQRMVQVQLNFATPQDPGYAKAFHAVFRRRGELLRLAKALVFGALHINNERIGEVMGRIDLELPLDLTARPRYCYQTLFLGLEFLKVVCDDLRLDFDDSLLKNALMKHITKEAKLLLQDKMRSEVDITLDEIFILIQQTLNKVENWLVRNTHYAVDNGVLYLDLPVIYAVYRSYRSRLHEKAVLESAVVFRSLVKQEPYFITESSIDGAKLLGLNRPVMALDMQKLAQKGLDISMLG